MERFRPRNTSGLAQRWKRGQSGNPGGRPKVATEVRDLARQHTPEAIQELARLCTKARKEGDRIKAIELLLDRGWGKVVPVGVDPMAPTAEESVSNVVRVPHVCQSVEQWQREADAWRRRNPPSAYDTPLLDPKRPN